MFFLKTFKTQLIAMAAISIASFIFLGLFSYNSSQESKELSSLQIEIKNVQRVILQLRRNEKDFLARKDLKYQAKYNKNFQKLMASVQKISVGLKNQDINGHKIQDLKNILNQYSKEFNFIISVQKEIGLNPKDGLYGSLRDSVHDLEDLLKKDSNYKLQADMLMLRRAEKDFMLRSNLKYLGKFDKSLKVFLKDIKSVKLSDNKKALNLLDNYKKDFYNLVEGYKKIGLTPKDGALGSMRSTIHKTDTKLNAMVESITVATNNKEEKANFQYIVIFIVLLLLLFILTYFITKKIHLQIKRISDSINNITKTKDISSSIEVHGEDELSLLAKNLNLMFKELNEVIAGAKKNSIENSSISQELSTTSLQVGENVESSVLILNEATTSTEAVTNEISQAVAEAQTNKDEMIEANDMLNIAKDEIVNLTHKVQDAAQAETELAVNIESLSKDMDQVKNVLTVISDIADQTNLLALNAAIEAARAGEHGRGFAVVADEVRKLAERTQKTLTEINATINIIVQSSNSAHEQMDINSKQMNELVTISIDVEGKINSTTIIVNNATNASDKTVEDFENTSSRINSIAKKIAEINTISINNAKSVEEIASASEYLNNMTASLTQKLEQFQTS